MESNGFAVKYIAVLLTLLVVGGGTYLYVHGRMKHNAEVQNCLDGLGGGAGADCGVR